MGPKPPQLHGLQGVGQLRSAFGPFWGVLRFFARKFQSMAIWQKSGALLVPFFFSEAEVIQCSKSEARLDRSCLLPKAANLGNSGYHAPESSTKS